MKAEVSDTISLRRGAQIIGLGMRAYNSRKRNGMVAPIVTVDGRELHERETFKLWLKENATALGWESNDPRLLAMLKKLEGNKMPVQKTLSAAVIAALSLFGSLPAHAQALSTGATVAAATPTLILQPVGAGTPRTYLKIQNVGLFSSGDAVAWCTFAASPAAVTSSQLHAALVPNAAGAIAIAPVENIRPFKTEVVFEGQNTPQGAVTCTSDGGSGGTSAAKLTITSLPQ